MKKTIDHPKVFISYSWGSSEHQEKVLSFATRLIGDGVDVILDKWDLTEGNDMNAFMEKCVNDPTVTNVLMLLDKVYAEKADKRAGGVGTETQIISAKVYQEVEQDKFIPIIFERDDDGNIYKPIYLQNRLHFDLSEPDFYEDNYARLVRKLFGVETYRKPEIGNRPDWVDTQISVNPQILVSYDSLKNNQPATVKRELLSKYLSDISSSLYNLSNEINTQFKDEEYLTLYDKTKPIRSQYLLLLSKCSFVPDAEKYITAFFEDTFNNLDINGSLGREICLVFLHELFLYTIGCYLKNHDYKTIGYILGKTYFNQHSYSDINQASSFTMFYSGSHHQNLDKAVKKKDNKNYYSGTANHWITSIDTNCCSKDDFVEADLICFNYAVYGDGYIDSYKWFPVTYIYDNEYNSKIKLLAKRLISNEQVTNILSLFNYPSLAAFKTKFAEVEGLIYSGGFREYRYPSAFETAPVLGYFIKAEQLGTMR